MDTKIVVYSMLSPDQSTPNLNSIGVQPDFFKSWPKCVLSPNAKNVVFSARTCIWYSNEIFTIVVSAQICAQSEAVHDQKRTSACTFVLVLSPSQRMLS